MAEKIIYEDKTKKSSTLKELLKTSTLALVITILSSSFYSITTIEKAIAQDGNVGLITQLTIWWTQIQQAAKVYNDHIDNVNKTMSVFDKTHTFVENMQNIDLHIEEQRQQISNMFDGRLKNGQPWTKFRLKKIDPDSLVTVNSIKSYYSEYDSVVKSLNDNSGKWSDEEKKTYSGKKRVLNAGISANIEAAQSEIFYSSLKQEIEEIEKDINSKPIDGEKKQEAMAMALIPIQVQIELRRLKLEAYAVKQRQAMLEMFAMGKPVANLPSFEESDLKEIIENAQNGIFSSKPKGK